MKRVKVSFKYGTHNVSFKVRPWAGPILILAILLCMWAEFEGMYQLGRSKGRTEATLEAEQVCDDRMIQYIERLNDINSQQLGLNEDLKNMQALQRAAREFRDHQQRRIVGLQAALNDCRIVSKVTDHNEGVLRAVEVFRDTVGKGHPRLFYYDVERNRTVLYKPDSVVLSGSKDMPLHFKIGTYIN